MRRKRTKIGDVLLLRLPAGIALLHYIGRHPVYGDAILVAPKAHVQDTPITDATFAGGYVTFYPASVAIARGLVEIAAHLPPPALPHRFRRAGARKERRVVTWIIEDGTNEVVKSELSAEDLQLPIAAIWNHELLMQRVSEGWRPADVGAVSDEGPAKAAPREAFVADEKRTVTHFIYVPDKAVAVALIRELKRKGFRTEERESEDGTDWLVLASHDLVPSEERMASAESMLETLAAGAGGRYDGRETAI